MAAGLPVVASDIPVFAEYLEPGGTHCQVPPGDDGALAAALDRVLTNENLAARLRAAASGWPASTAGPRKPNATSDSTSDSMPRPRTSPGRRPSAGPRRSLHPQRHPDGGGQLVARVAPRCGW